MPDQPRAEPAAPVYVGLAWRVVLRDVGVDEQAVLRRGSQPADLLDGDGSWVSLDTYYDLFDAVEAEAGDLEVAVRAGSVVSAELFDPAYFAAICSPDLNTALRRLGDYMELVGAFRLDVDIAAAATTARYTCKYRADLPATLGVSQLAFLVALARRATRQAIVPQRVTFPQVAGDLAGVEEFFGCRVDLGDDYEVSFGPFDARRTFLTRNDEMWETFQPGLRRQMDEAGESQTFRADVEAALMELLPSGRSGLADAARELGVGRRTLQRRLADEGTSWLDVLNDTRDRLARHYVESTDLSLTEVGFLLGFTDPNSLFRAFQRWTGTTPEVWRARSKSV